jgi:hypothetical protein
VNAQPAIRFRPQRRGLGGDIVCVTDLPILHLLVDEGMVLVCDAAQKCWRPATPQELGQEPPRHLAEPPPAPTQSSDQGRGRRAQWKQELNRHRRSWR